MNTELLKTIADSHYWEELKGYLVHYIDNVDRVSKPLEVNGVTITPEQAYLGKLLAVKTLNEFINSIDSLKNIKEREQNSRDLMI